MSKQKITKTKIRDFLNGIKFDPNETTIAPVVELNDEHYCIARARILLQEAELCVGADSERRVIQAIKLQTLSVLIKREKDKIRGQIEDQTNQA